MHPADPSYQELLQALGGVHIVRCVHTLLGRAPSTEDAVWILWGEEKIVVSSIERHHIWVNGTPYFVMNTEAIYQVCRDGFLY